MREQHRRAAIDVDDGLELARVELQERCDAADGGVVHHESDLAVGDLGPERDQKIAAGEVERDGPHRHAVSGLDLGGGRLEERAVAVDQHQVESTSRQLARPLRAESHGGAGDQRPGSVSVSEARHDGPHPSEPGAPPPNARGVLPAGEAPGCKKRRLAHAPPDAL